MKKIVRFPSSRPHYENPPLPTGMTSSPSPRQGMKVRGKSRRQRRCERWERKKREGMTGKDKEKMKKKKNATKTRISPFLYSLASRPPPPLFPISIQTPNHSLSRGQVSNARCDWPRACPKWSGFADSLKYVFARPRYCPIFSLCPHAIVLFYISILLWSPMKT